ncbi:MAG: hypothetical protein K0U37_01040 [Gammaproteobacteria bacterium]|nr:hypothetical protein [Gammaproteobacteria bacterium]
MFFYHAFQLIIQSELVIPELLSLPDNLGNRPAHVVIEFGEVSETGLSRVVAGGAFYQSNETELWLNVPKVARYLISNGNHITIDPDEASDEDSIRVFLLGSCMGALLMQRDLFLLHANAVKMGAHCISFSGHSGAGKSTLSGAFMRRGYSILADDVCAINSMGEVIPSFPQIKLWADSSKKLEIQTNTFRRIRPNFEKFSVPLEAQFCSVSLPLKVVYILNSHNLDTFEFNAVEGMKKVLPLKNNTYRYQYLKGLGQTKKHLKHTGAIASQASVVRITRPRAGFRLDELVDLIEADLSARGLSSV